MMENKDTNKKLQDHERRISALEKLMGDTKKPKIKGSKQSLSDYMLELRDGGFFSQPKTAEDVHSKLNVKYPCEVNRVAVALVRLAGKKQLRKASKIVDKKKYKAYVW
jgi:hypothetical protein